MTDIKQLKENGVPQYLKTHVKAIDGISGALVQSTGNETVLGTKNFKDGLQLNGLDVQAGMKIRTITTADILDTSQISELSGAFIRIGNIVICQYRVNNIKGFDTNSLRNVMKIPSGFGPYFAGLAYLPMRMTRSDRMDGSWHARATDTGNLAMYATTGNTYVNGFWTTQAAWPA